MGYLGMRSSKIVARLSAIVGPALVMAGALWWLGHETAPPAGTNSPEVAAMDAAMATGPDVVFLGSSKVTTDIDYEAVATALGMPRDKIVTLSIPSSSAPLWYTMLQERIVRGGHHPSRVVVYSPLQFLVATELADETQRTRLYEQMPLPDPVLVGKVRGLDVDAFGALLHRRRGEVQSGLRDRIRDGVVRAVSAFRGSDAGPEASAESATDGLHEVFAEAGGERPDTVGPIVQVDDPTHQTTTTPNPRAPMSIDQTLLPDMLNLADEAHIRLLFVLAPYGHEDRQAPQLEADAIVLVNAHHAGWLDLRDDGPPPSALPDLVHMSPAGRRQFAPNLVAALVNIGLKGDQFTPAQAWRPAFQRTGTPPTLTTPAPQRGEGPCDWELASPAYSAFGDVRLLASGLGMVSPLTLTLGGQPLTPHAAGHAPFAACTGVFRHSGASTTFAPFDAPELGASVVLGLSEDVPLRSNGSSAYWVYPGTTLAADVSFPPGASLYLRAKVYGGSGATVTLGAATATMSLAGELPNLAGEGVVPLSIHSVDSFVLLTQLSVGDAQHAEHYVGSAKPRRIAASRSMTFVLPPAPVPALPPPQPTGLPEVFRIAGGVPGLPTSKEVQAALDTSCLPVVVMVDGARSDALNADKQPQAIVTGAPEGLLVTRKPGFAMGAPGQIYTYALSESRQCTPGQSWLYPGDDLRTTIAASDLVLTGADELELTGAIFAEPGAVLHVLVTSVAGTHLDRDVTGAMLAAGGVTLPLDLLVPAGSPGVTIHITNAGATYAALSGLWLTQSPPRMF